MAEINLPIEDSQQLIVKYSENEREEVEVVYINMGTTQFNVAKYIYEFICLAVPMIKTYDCESEKPPVCNSKVVKYLDQAAKRKESKESNPIWDELNKLNN